MTRHSQDSVENIKYELHSILLNFKYACEEKRTIGGRMEAVEKLTALLQSERREAVEEFITDGWGKRCKIKDIVDFPELKHDPKANRCPTCEMYESYDEWRKSNGKL